MTKRTRYKITVSGPSFWRQEEGQPVQYNASGRNIVEMTLEEYRKNKHLGLVIAGKAEAVEIDADGVADQNNKSDDASDGDEKETLPEDWKDLTKAKKAALHRKFLGKAATGLSEEEIDEALEAYGDN